MRPTARMKRTATGWVVAGMSVVLLASACGSGDSEDADSGGGGASGAGGGGGGEITSTFMKSGTYDLAAETLAERFEAAGNGTVAVEAFPYADLRQRNTTSIISGGCDYNVVSGSYYLADIYDNFESLDSYIESSGYAEKLTPGLLDNSEIYQGANIGLPYGPDTYALAVNTELLNGAGITTYPETWTELLATLETLQGTLPAGTSGFAFAQGQPDQMPALLMSTYEGTFINADGKFELETEKAVAAIELSKELLTYASEASKGQSIDAANAEFTNGDAVFLLNFPSLLRTSADESPIAGKYEIIELPTPGRPWLSLWQLYMASCTEDKDLAWEWMTTFSDAENDEELFVEYGVNPSFQATYDKLEAEYGYVLNALKLNIARSVNVPLSGAAQDYMASTIGEFILGSLPAEDAVARINEEWQKDEYVVPPSILESATKNGLVEE